MKKIILLLFALVFTSGLTYAQEETKLIILEAKIDKADYTDIYLQNEAFLVFYYTEDEQLNMANVFPKEESQSYGKVSMWTEEKENPDTPEGYKTESFVFRWSYINTYDTKTGSAVCNLKKIYKPSAIAYELYMLTEDASTLEFKGYIDGTLKKY